jgi:hypothetical protein
MRIRRACAALVATVLGGAPGAGAEDPASLEELFKWGEYDSLIQALEPARADADGGAVLRGLASRADSAEEARARMYLGVAYWATGRPGDGARAFTVATRLDESLRLDPLYATAEMAALFEQIAEAGRAPSPGPSSSPAPPEPGRAPAATPGHPGMRPATRPSPWAWWTGVAVAGAAGAAGTYLWARSWERPQEVITIIDPGRSP